MDELYDLEPNGTWTRAELLRVASLYHHKGLTQQTIAEGLGKSRQEVNRMLKAAESKGIVRVVIVDMQSRAGLHALGRKLCDTFPTLKDAWVVEGHPGIQDGPEFRATIELQGEPEPTPDEVVKASEAIEDAVSLNIAHAAGVYLSSLLSDEKIVMIGRGRMMKALVASTRSPKPLRRLRIVPMSGFMNAQHDLLDANVIAEDLQRVTEGMYFWLPLPAMLPRQHEKIIKELPLVADTLEMMEKANVVITGIGNTERFMTGGSVLSKEDIKASLQSRPNAVGEICNTFYDSKGETLEHNKWYAPGFSLERMRELSRDKEGTVIGVVGADVRRFNAILGALDGGLINVLITDHITARAIIEMKQKASASMA